MNRPLAIVLSAIALPLSISAQQPKVLAPHDPIAPKVSKQMTLRPAAPGSIAGGPWMVDANFKSTIYLKNIVETSAITVTPVLHLSNGKKYRLSPVQMEASGTATVDINASLQGLGIASYSTLSGWVEMQYSWPWVPLCAVIRNVDVAHSLIFTFGYDALGASSSSGTSQSASQVVEGLWWRHESNVTGFLTLSNTTSQPVKALVQVSDNHAEVLGTYNVTISAEGMKTLNLQELQTAAVKEGGIRVSYLGQPESLLINGGLEDPNVGYSANLRFAPPARPAPPFAHPTTQQGMAELGLMVGAADPMMRFPAGTMFAPYSVLRNVSAAQISVTPTLWWMEAGAAASFQLPQFTMLPYETRSLDLTSALAAAGLRNFNGSFNLVLDTKGDSGLLMAGGSVDQTNTYVFEVGARGIVKSAGKALSYWSTGNGDDTMVMLWNPADEAQDFTFRLTFAGGHYNFPIQLGPRASRTFNVSEIVAGQGPDAQGNVVPGGIQEGSAKIVGDQADNQNILVVMDSGVYNVRKATCGGSCQNCDGVTSSSVLQDPFGVGVGLGYQADFLAQYCSGGEYDLTGSSTWSSSNTSIATVQTGLVHGVSVGSFVVNAGNSSAPVCAPQCNPYGSCPAFQGAGGSAPGATTNVSFSPIYYLQLGQSAAPTATVQPLNNAVPISLSISCCGTVTPTTITQTTSLLVKANALGTATITATIPSSDGGQPQTVGSTQFQVVSAKSCPASIAISGNPTVFNLQANDPPWLTGIGIADEMLLVPNNQDYTGQQISESVTGSQTCSTQVFTNICSGSDTWTIGVGDKAFNTTFPGGTNIFWDMHVNASTQDRLTAAQQTSCTATCTQTYSCGGKQLPGTFTINFSFSKDTINGQSVTQVKVTKQ